MNASRALLLAALLGCLSGIACAASLTEEELRLLRAASLPAQDSNKAMELARRLGGEASVEGLDAILQARNQWRLGDYVYGFNYKGAALSPQLEALMVAHFAADDNRFAFMRMIGEGRAQYRSRAMFDALLSVLDKEMHDRSFAYERSRLAVAAMVKTDLAGIEASLLQRLTALPRAPAFGGAAAIRMSAYGMTVQFLARRKYLPAAPVLAERLTKVTPEADPQQSEAALLFAGFAAIDPGTGSSAAAVFLDRLGGLPYDFAVASDMQRALDFILAHGAPPSTAQLTAWLRGKPPNDRFAASIVQALLKTPQKEAIDAVIDRIASVGVQTTPPPLEVEQALSGLAGLRDQGLLDYARLRKALPGGMSQAAVAAHIRLIERRREVQAIPDDLIPYLAGPYVSDALRLIIDSGSIDTWRRAQAGVDALRRDGKLEEERYQYLISRLGEVIVDPDRHFAGKRQAALARAYEEDRRRIDALRAEPERWIAAAEELRVKYAGLPAAATLASDIRSAYARYAAETRFTRKQPERAIALYEKAARNHPLEGWDFLTDVVAADIYQFDLRSPEKALRRYEAARASLMAGLAKANVTQKGFVAPWQAMLDHEIAYLRSGRRFTGRLTKDDIGGFYRAMYALSALELIVPDVPRAPADSLPPSRFRLPGAVSGLAAQTDARTVLRFLERNDPSGYWSACLLGLTPWFEDSVKRNPNARDAAELKAQLPPAGSALRRAADQFFQARKVALHFPPPDSRRSTPEKTWSLFIASLGRGDLETAYQCLTPQMRGRLEPRLSAMNAQSLEELVQSFSGFTLTQGSGEMREAVVRRGERAGFVYFLEVDGEWKIEEM